MIGLIPEEEVSDRNVSGRLKTLVSRSDSIGSWVAFWTIAAWSLGAFHTFSSPAYYFDYLLENSYELMVDRIMSDLRPFLEGAWDLFLLAIATRWWFGRYRRAVGNEIVILDRLFPLWAPDDWDRVTGSSIVVFLSVGITVVFLLMAASLQILTVYAFLMLLLWSMDLVGNQNLCVNLQKYLNDSRARLPNGYPYLATTNQRRKIAEEYWLEKPQLARVVVLILCTMIVFLLLLSGDAYGFNVPRFVPVFILISMILVNEWIMTKWRAVRTEALAEVREAEERVNREAHGSEGDEDL